MWTILCASESSPSELQPLGVFSDGSPEKSPEEEKREKEAIERIVKDIPEEEEEHLDLTLEQEAEFLSQYLALLKSLPS